MKKTAILLSVILITVLLAGWLWFKNTQTSKQALEHTARLRNWVRLQELLMRNELTGADSNLLSGLLKEAAEKNDSLLLQSYNATLQWQKQQKEQQPLHSTVVIKPNSTSGKVENEQISTTEKRALEDSLKRAHVLLEMGKSMAQKQVERFKKMSDSLLTILGNKKDIETGILYFKSPQGINIQYVGEIRQNKAHGFGMGIWENGHKYQGFWENGKKHGKGTYFFPNGDIYSGDFVSNKREGKGEYTFSKGDVYLGYWTNDFRNGIGFITGKKGKIIKAGVWENDRLNTNRRLTSEELMELKTP